MVPLLTQAQNESKQHNSLHCMNLYCTVYPSGWYVLLQSLGFGALRGWDLVLFLPFSYPDMGGSTNNTENRFDTEKHNNTQLWPFILESSSRWCFTEAG